jgi:hypothetical protein
MSFGREPVGKARVFLISAVALALVIFLGVNLATAFGDTNAILVLFVSVFSWAIFLAAIWSLRSPETEWQTFARQITCASFGLAVGFAYLFASVPMRRNLSALVFLIPGALPIATKRKWLRWSYDGVVLFFLLFMLWRLLPNHA